MKFLTPFVFSLYKLSTTKTITFIKLWYSSAVSLACRPFVRSSIWKTLVLQLIYDLFHLLMNYHVDFLKVLLCNQFDSEIDLNRDGAFYLALWLHKYLYNLK